jgi:Kef-type K+ transport system membrane component KefB
MFVLACVGVLQVVFLPLYFTFSGLRTDIHQIKGAEAGLMFLMVRPRWWW